MKVHRINRCAPLLFHMAGYFCSPDPNWTHLSRLLTDYELMVVVKGTLYIADGQREFTVKEGEYLLLAPGSDQHGYLHSQCEFFWVHFTDSELLLPQEMDPNSASFSDEIIAVPEYGVLNDTTVVWNQMRLLLKHHRLYDDPYIAAADTMVVLSLLQHQCLRERPASQSVVKKDDLQGKILDYLNWHIHENIRVSQVATHLGYNEKYLSTLFTAMTGESIKHYILVQKMEIAKRQLTNTNVPITAIAANMGFSDSHNFSTAFKKIVGMSPREYRKEYRE